VGLSPLFADDRKSATAASARDDRRARAAAAAAGAAFVDLFAVTNGLRSPVGFLGSDRFHPSDRGYAVLESAFAPVLEHIAGSIR
jgi:lysophospholipase L1-like esterase